MKKIKKILVLVDVQNDFITGSLANKDAQKVVPDICKYIKESRIANDYDQYICTRDTHDRDYLETQEGKNLPIEHCIVDTAGWCIETNIQKALFEKLPLCTEDIKYRIVDKAHFGTVDWDSYIWWEDIEEIDICGFCTSICVAANATILKTMFPEAKINVIANLCADINTESHEAALTVMKNQQINIK